MMCLGLHHLVGRMVLPTMDIMLSDVGWRSASPSIGPTNGATAQSPASNLIAHVELLNAIFFPCPHFKLCLTPALASVDFLRRLMAGTLACVSRMHSTTGEPISRPHDTDPRLPAFCAPLTRGLMALLPSYVHLQPMHSHAEVGSCGIPNGMCHHLPIRHNGSRADADGGARQGAAHGGKGSLPDRGCHLSRWSNSIFQTTS